jgi:anti-anti-sigma factor
MFKIVSNVDKNTIYIQGDLVFSCVNEAEKSGFQTLTKCFNANITHINIDLSEVKAVDSSLMAVLLSWIKFASSKGAQLKFIAIPKAVESLIQLNNLNNIFHNYTQEV